MFLRWLRAGFRFVGKVVLGVMLVLSTLFGGMWLARPARVPVEEPLFQGVSYRRLIKDSPRPVVIHVAEIDLTAPGIQLKVTPPDPAEGRELRASTTREFLRRYDLQLAINGSFFDPFIPGGLFNYYPHSGDPVNVMGQSTSDGVTYSNSDGKRGTLCIMKGNQAIFVRGTCPEGVEQALAGHLLLVDEGKVAKPKDFDPEPRTVVGIDRSGKRLSLVVVDGRQAGYSEGLSMQELADLCAELGLYTALNLDGGGSSTMVRERWLYPALINAPIHTRIPLRERPVANHLGVMALPLED